MKIEIRKTPSSECDLFINNRKISTTFSLHILMRILLNNISDKLTIKTCYLPFKGNTIGLKRVSNSDCYEVIYSDFKEVLIGTQVVMCSIDFRKVVGIIPYCFFHSYYFTINQTDE